MGILLNKCYGDSTLMIDRLWRVLDTAIISNKSHSTAKWPWWARSVMVIHSTSSVIHLPIPTVRTGGDPPFYSISAYTTTWIDVSWHGLAFQLSQLLHSPRILNFIEFRTLRKYKIYDRPQRTRLFLHKNCLFFGHRKFFILR